jgi:hypothetical protein
LLLHSSLHFPQELFPKAWMKTRRKTTSATPQ